jgi:hypothetical protein
MKQKLLNLSGPDLQVVSHLMYLHSIYKQIGQEQRLERFVATSPQGLDKNHRINWEHQVL